jgi:hypothetical protein
VRPRAKGGRKRKTPAEKNDNLDRYGVKKVTASKHPPKGDRPKMRRRQVKPPNRNRSKHSFAIDAK